MEGRLRLITGGKGAAKTLWTVDQLFKEYEKNPDRSYYSDITKLQHTGVKDAPDDWRDIPDNSLIVYDEVQFKALFSRHNSKRDLQILELTTMRKRGVEMWIITQRARFLNADVLGLVDEHVHIERNGKKTSKVFIFGEAEVNITRSKKLFAFDKYVFAHPTHLYGFYESIKDGAKHGTKSYLNKGVISTLITLVLMFGFGGWFIYKSFVSNGMKISAGQPEQQKSNVAPPVANTQNPFAQNDLETECRKGINVDKPQCVEWFKNYSEQVSQQTNYKQVSYDPNNPYSYTYAPEAKPTTFPRMSGVVMLKNGKYSAVDQHGNYMPEISQNDCKKWLSGYRPFDYFKNESESFALTEKPIVQDDHVAQPASNLDMRYGSEGGSKI